MREKLPNQVRIKYHVPVPPLVFDVHLLPKSEIMVLKYIWAVTAGESADCHNVEIDGEDVVLSCQQPLQGDVIVVYAGTNSFIEEYQGGKTDCRDMEICVTVIRIRLFLTI